MRPEKRFAGFPWISFTELSCVRPSNAHGETTPGPFGRIRFHRIYVVALQANQLRPASSVGHCQQSFLASSTATCIHQYAPISVDVELASEQRTRLTAGFCPAQLSGFRRPPSIRVKKYPVRQATTDEPYPLRILKTYHLIRSAQFIDKATFVQSPSDSHPQAKGAFTPDWRRPRGDKYARSQHSGTEIERRSDPAGR